MRRSVKQLEQDANAAIRELNEVGMYAIKAAEIAYELSEDVRPKEFSWVAAST